MINKLMNNNSNMFWMLIHVLIGAMGVISNWFLIVWVYAVIIFSINKIISSLYLRGSVQSVIPLLVYVCSFEVLARMTTSYPFIPWELSKYFIIATSLFLLLAGKIEKTSSSGLLIIMLLIPGLLIDKSNLVVTNQIIFDTLGLMSLGFLMIVVGGVQVKVDYLNSIIKLIWLTSVSLLVSIIIKTPALDNLTFSLNVDFTTTGGFGSNQVVTIIGIGMFFSFYAWMNKLLFSGSHTIDGLFIGLFAYQGFLSFSRGGMVIGILSILIYYFMFRKSKSFQTFTRLRALRPFLFFIFAITILVLSYSIIDNISDGNITNRYLGETVSTLNKTKVKTINTISTGRYALLVSDLLLWRDNLIFGVGSGASTFLRESNLVGLAAHTEFSRLLAEHGLFGLVIIFLLGWQLIKVYQINNYNINGALLFALCFIAIGTSMHSAMRTFVTPLFFVMSTFIPENE
tara:strand:+ start:1000 stop:2370 length:1371 start_codon:yes stop_codon:yes gene_type:complete